MPSLSVMGITLKGYQTHNCIKLLYFETFAKITCLSYFFSFHLAIVDCSLSTIFMGTWSFFISHGHNLERLPNS